ncbi:Amiloride-sensitive sodium channel subunit alpha [Platysternon megacephalum]|uniref:Amiloride-sensitive sodium channel subunit alpha n=1 Tax=Platysternon megacephalum TaxID=55544 RepID=A0A4D9DS14_9SAUR|nr:Amiloride-sensitive sodium channel subunit alpha [Platysternon megacephalum]
MGLCFKLTVPFQILFLVFGICFLPGQAASTGTRNYSDPVPKPTNASSSATDPVINPTTAISNVTHWMQILNLTLVGLILFTSIITLLSIYWWRNRGNRRVLHDPERGHPRVSGDRERGPLLEQHVITSETPRTTLQSEGDLQEKMGDLQEKLNQLKNEKVKLEKESEQLKNEKEKLETENEWRKACCKRDDITLDAETAHPNLSIDVEKKSFKHEAQPQNIPPNPERFDSTVCVLGSEGFSSDKHYWEVEVVSSSDWDLGVAKKSIQRKGKLSLSPKEGFWALGLSARDYWAKTDPWTRVMVQKKPQKIGVYLNYEEQKVTFLSVNDMSVLFTFNDCSFSGEVYPFFKNSHKETIMRICS